jgi:hypothetical protein
MNSKRMVRGSAGVGIVVVLLTMAACAELLEATVERRDEQVMEHREISVQQQREDEARRLEWREQQAKELEQRSGGV